MTLTRRLSAREAGSDATERVVRWLAEAHAFGSFDAYVDHTLDEGPESLSLNRLPREAIAAIRDRRGPRTRDVDEEIRETLRSLLFRVHLVFRIIERTSEVIEREELVLALLTAEVCLALEVRPEENHRMGGLPQLRDLSMFRVTELLALQEARERVAERYLTGTECLFPEAARSLGRGGPRGSAGSGHGQPSCRVGRRRLDRPGANDSHRGADRGTPRGPRGNGADQDAR